MKFHEVGGLCYYSFESLDHAGVTSAVFTRKGGVSPSPWNTLNVGGTLGDDRTRVVKNRELTFAAVRKSVESIFDVWQVHSTRIVRADQPRPLDQPHQKADGILTDKPGVSLFMRFGDCVPILLFDPERRAIGLVHAGWKGTVNRIAKLAVEAMKQQFDSRPDSIQACIGPSICPEHYPVGMDVVRKVKQAFDSRSGEILKRDGSQTRFDLWKANQIVLEEQGIKKIEIAGICTACHPDEWFSHRGENGKTGRFGVLFAL